MRCDIGILLMLFGYFCLYLFIVEEIGLSFNMHLLKKSVVNSMVLEGKKIRAFKLFGFLNIWLKESMGIDG